MSTSTLVERQQNVNLINANPATITPVALGWGRIAIRPHKETGSFRLALDGIQEIPIECAGTTEWEAFLKVAKMIQVQEDSWDFSGQLPDGFRWVSRDQ